MGQLKLWWPETAVDLAHHRPTREEWEAELESGWPGPNGSSASLDNIEGIDIGGPGPAFVEPVLPARGHDYDYRVIRRLVALRIIGEADRERLQAAADMKHYAGLLLRVSVLVGWNGWKARRRARVRYLATRLLGRSSTLPTDEEAYRVQDSGEVA